MRGPVVVGVGALALTGCTFLVDFVTKPTIDCDGGPCLDGSSTIPDEGAPVDAGGGTKPDAVSDVQVEAAQCTNPCDGRNGWYCGNDGLNCLAPQGELYHCTTGAITAITNCAPALCLALPKNHPDTCDPCASVADGQYCGSDFPTVVPQPATDPADKDYLFYCVSHRSTFSSTACANGCGGTAPNARCD